MGHGSLHRGFVGAAALAALVSMPFGARAQEGPTLAFGGDVLYDAPLRYQIAHRAEEVGVAQAFDEVFEDLSSTLGEADLAVVNLEVPISPRYRERDTLEDVPVFRAPPTFLSALRRAGIDAVTLANNHAYDQGLRGLRHTLSATARESLTSIGAGENAEEAARAVTIPVGSARLSIAAWSEGTNHRPRRSEGARPRVAFLHDGTIERSLRAARAQSDLLVAVFHWTREDITMPSPMMRRVARSAAEAGADLVVGHGTHLPGRTEVVRTSDGRDVRVLYSLGNLLAAMEEPAGMLSSREVGVRDAPLAFVRTLWHDGRLVVQDVDIRHHWIARPLGAAPWLSEGRLAVSRPVAIARELERLRNTNCGHLCEQRAAAYRRRVDLIDAAMADVAAISPGQERTHDRATPFADSARGVSADMGGAISERPSSARVRRPPRTRVVARSVIADGDPRLAPFLRGTSLGASFPPGGIVPGALDETQLRRLVDLLRADHTLRVEIVGYATAQEARERTGLASLRARRIKGLIAIRGPSRSRFSVRGAEGPNADVRVRVQRSQ